MGEPQSARENTLGGVGAPRTHHSIASTFSPCAAAPSSTAASYSVPYFVVVHEGARIYAKHAYTLDFSFAPGAAMSVIKHAPNQTRIKIDNGKLPWNYQLLVGFQMTDQQIAYNKAKNRYQQ